MRSPAVQRHMPRRRSGHTTAVTIGHERFYVTANAREDGSLGELFIQWGKQGRSCSGLMDTYAIAWSVALQHGVPLADLIRHSLDLYFVPNGQTDDPQIPRARSIADYIARRLAIDWLPARQRAELGILTIEEKLDQASHWMARLDTQLSVPQHQDDRLRALRWSLATSLGTAPSTPDDEWALASRS
jgi:ribonucleoside-diphosphate reductase alpha chain